ncbi:hypothetical protein AB0942_32405 [Streptomyces nodosus]|uniref:hypothetical protein n=1 Tax=Streptomyces nodosus TaxID=40318 RepID=UPI0034539ED5
MKQRPWHMSLVLRSHPYKGWPLYATAAALALDGDLVRSVVAERLTWEAASLPRDAAAERIGRQSWSYASASMPVSA